MTRSYDLNHPLNDQFADCCNQLISWSISLVWSMFLTLALSEQKLIYNDSIQGDNPTFIKMSWCTIGETFNYLIASINSSWFLFFSDDCSFNKLCQDATTKSSSTDVTKTTSTYEETTDCSTNTSGQVAELQRISLKILGVPLDIGSMIFVARIV